MIERYYQYARCKILIDVCTLLTMPLKPFQTEPMKANVKATSILITRRLQDHMANIKENLGFIYTCDSLGMNYCMNYSLNNGLYCSKWAYLHFIFGQLLQELKSSMMDCVPIFTGRKQSLGQGNFLHLCVILFTVGRRSALPPDADPPL